MKAIFQRVKNEPIIHKNEREEKKELALINRKGSWQTHISH